MYKVLSAIMMVAMLGAAGTSTSPHGRITGAQVMPGTGSVMNLTNVAVFQDWDPWGTTAITDILTAHSITFTIYGTADIGNVDLSNFDKVIFPSQQSFDFYLALSVNSPWLEAYIDNGGCVELHFATYDTYDPTGLVFAYGISVMHYPTVPAYDDVDRTVPGHEVFNVPNPVDDAELDNWGYSSHGYFSDYPAGATVLAVNVADTTPAMIEYRPAGGILATIMPVEWAWAYGDSDVLENMLLYCGTPTDVEESSGDLASEALAVRPSVIGNSAMVSFSVPRDGFASIKVYDATGKVVDVLGGTFSAGSHEITWSPRVESGVYFLSIEGPGVSQTTKVIVER